MAEHAEGFTEDDVRRRAHEISLRPDAGTADGRIVLAPPRGSASEGGGMGPHPVCFTPT